MLTTIDGLKGGDMESPWFSTVVGLIMVHIELCAIMNLISPSYKSCGSFI